MSENQTELCSKCGAEIDLKEQGYVSSASFTEMRMWALGR
jgi:hypothetical protein